MATDVPTDPALDAAIRAIPSWEGQELEILPIAEGRTNRNFRVAVGDETFFLRLSEKSTELLGIDRTAEQDSARAAAEAGVGPEVFVYLPELGCLVTRWIDAEALSEGDLEREEVLTPVVEAIKAIHAGPALAWTFDPFRIVEDYRRISEERGVAVPDAFDPAHEKASRIEAAFASDPMPIRPCHNDLLEANFLLRDGRVWVVDHEYAGMGDPFFDLGNVSINHELTPDEDEALLAAYEGSARPDRLARLQLMRVVSDFREAMWGVLQQGISTLDVDFVAYAGEHFDRLLANASTSAFERAVRVASGD
jgi:thiamine kinase-like enzyme